MLNYTVLEIPPKQTHEWLLKKHYAHRIPSITYAFGLYDNSEMLQGICTFGTPSSSTLRIGVCGESYSEIVIELNRLCLNDGLPNNSASYFVSRCLKKLPNPKVIISYSDKSQGHTGYIYQACNFIYTGLSAKRTDWKIKGLEKLHGQSIADISRHQVNRVEYMREKYGDDFYLEDRARKHRYVYFLGNKRQVHEMKINLKYPIMPYPKGDNKRYDASFIPDVQLKF
jgi:hypothetical protein